MKKNSRMSGKKSVITAISFHFLSIVAAAFVVAILNILASTHNQQLTRAIGEYERELDKLEDAYARESTRWEEMKTPEKLSAALKKHALSMKPPRPDQYVYMKPDGTPYPGLAVTRAARRRAPTANNSVRTKR